MKSLVHSLTTLTATTAAMLVSSWSLMPAAIASQFSQQPITRDRIITVAEPVNNGRFYNLLIIEQIGSVRQCWSEQGSNPTVVTPLLLNFDFSGICGRSSDSNGYSVRIGGEDTRYRLQVVQRESQLVLVAAPSALQRTLPTLEIGRSTGLANDFIKIELDAGWELTRRVYNGQPLGHIYVTNNQPLETVIAAAGGTTTPPPVTTPPPATGSPPILRPPTSGTPLPVPGSAGSATGDFRVVVPGNSDVLRQRVQAVAPDAFRANINGQAVIQAGRFQDRAVAEDLQRRLGQANLTAQIIVGQGTFTPPPAAGNPSGDTFYQVIVPGSSELLRARVSAVEPGAFRTTVNGQGVIQAGKFQEANRAEELKQRLVAAGFPAQIIQGSGAIASTPLPDGPRQTGIVVVIDPGHGGRDPGAIGRGGLQEKEINIAISRRIQEVLEQRGIQVVMTRTGDSTLDLQPRVDIAEQASATVFVSIHANAISLSRPEVNGLETYYYSSGASLARSIHDSVLASTDLRDRGVRQARFYVIRNTSMPAVLVETGYVTGSEDAVRFQNAAARQQIADAIAQGILNYVQ